MDFINKIKLPILYDAFVESWKDLDRSDKADLIMNYIDNIELSCINNKYIIKQVNFRSTFYTEFKELFDKGYIDWKIKVSLADNVHTKVRYSEYLLIGKVMQHLYRLNMCYDVGLYKSSMNLETGEYQPLLLDNTSIIRIFPTQKREKGMKEIGMAMLYTKRSPNDIKVDYHDIFEHIPDEVCEEHFK